jgi:pimeloyl-ACP methyl ester carboxylesterase
VVNATLVTIHGFWSSPATWQRLIAIWDADEQLHGLQIAPFGYPSPKKPLLPFSTTRVPDYDDIAQTLATEYTVRPAEAHDIAIVTHSQGGLILQRFLTWMLNQGRGRELARIRTIVMLACPNGGSEYLRSIRHVLGFGHHPQAGNLEVLNRQIADTQRTVLQRIVNATGVDDHQCRIPFHVYAGDSDQVVTPASAQGAFPGASTLAGNHFSILDPAASGNRTAETVRYHILTDLAASPAPDVERHTRENSEQKGLRPSSIKTADPDAARALYNIRATLISKLEYFESQLSTSTQRDVVSQLIDADEAAIKGVEAKLQDIGMPLDPSTFAVLRCRDQYWVSSRLGGRRRG